ncbi:putative carboxylesterase, 2-hydroxyisoflavanone dehydratase [Rosa chinensis]|uniref:Putative carboxylesterase, 2-hydroxyisoflavanone dehydratase n=1 Tax=Rosa chinensis TaxID=74649 RepID=A0A2P6PMM7_ROSCH|nr:2-hydroxyisoflavanone dehydratase [Rosa chinensis]PRQ23193.1 putative carboxylesterase, 2-hydroxyisoflavanone dehydratase [Rosa chinensis]
MDSNNNEIIHDFPPFFKVFKDGRIERYVRPRGDVPAGPDPTTGVQSKDVVVSPETGVKACILIPKINGEGQKLPLLVNYHGGGFCLGSAFEEIFKKFLSSLVLKANVIVVSVDYRLAPEHPLPIAYDDSSAALHWIASHSDGEGPEAWLNEYADLDRVFLGGESAGANIAHYVAVQAGVNVPVGLNIVGLVMLHPFFGGKECDKMYKFLSSTSSGCDDDPKLNPAADPDLVKLPCRKVLVCVAEKDWLRDRGVSYYETLEKLKGEGFAELFETKGEDHCFYLFNPNADKAGHLLQKVVDFFNI